MLIKRKTLGLMLAATMVVATGCADGEEPADDGLATTSSSTTTTTASSSSSGSGGAGGGTSCPIDCTTLPAQDCQLPVCNDGQYDGEIGKCVYIDEADDAACDDGLFCTDGDTCQAGVCTPGVTNDCGLGNGDSCNGVTCNEATDSCSLAPVADGQGCTTADLCLVNGVCTAGTCTGQPKDCTFSPVNECQTATCEPATGMCVGQMDPSKDGNACVNSGDLCMNNKTCAAGQCVGGNPVDCTALDVGCQNGVCNANNGMCEPQAVMPGQMCNSGGDQCNVGICDNASQCIVNPVMDGTACDDFSTCTTTDVCTAGTCGGVLDPTCSIYFEERFEVCPAPGWTMALEWECGTPTMVGPATAYQGTGVLGTDLDSTYENSQSYDLFFAQTPVIGLGTATAPVLHYFHYVDTESISFDGYNIKVSTDGGTTFSVLANVTPAYDGTLQSQMAWGGDQSGLGWQEIQADLSAYIGQQIILRFSFRTDGSGVDPGIYIDDVTVGEAADIPVSIGATNLPDAFSTFAYAANLTSGGGTGTAQWSITGGTNHTWLTIDPNTGALSGTPLAANIGAVSVDVHLEEPTNSANFDDATFAFNVGTAIYFDDMEAACPGTWTLAGSWQCGVPTSGPNAAFSGTQVIATNLAGNYADSLNWATNTASSAPISLVGTTAPSLAFRVWYNTEGSTYDGWNVKISTDGGANYTLAASVMPAYALTVGGQMCWGGDQSAAGWQVHTVDLSAFAGMTVNLQFALQSDSIISDPGTYIDNVLISD